MTKNEIRNGLDKILKKAKSLGFNVIYADTNSIIIFTQDTVFCDICNELVSKNNAQGFPEEQPKEWICKKCIKNDKIQYLFIVKDNFMQRIFFVTSNDYDKARITFLKLYWKEEYDTFDIETTLDERMEYTRQNRELTIIQLPDNDGEI